MTSLQQLNFLVRSQLRYSGWVLLGWCWLRMAEAAAVGDTAGDAFLAGKLHTADFYFDRLLPRTRTLAATLRAEGGPLLDMEAEAFAR